MGIWWPAREANKSELQNQEEKWKEPPSGLEEKLQHIITISGLLKTPSEPFWSTGAARKLGLHTHTQKKKN